MTRSFFKAEDGIRDRNVTGVQTCALPLSPKASSRRRPKSIPALLGRRTLTRTMPSLRAVWISRETVERSEERRVGKECRYGGGRAHGERNTTVGTEHTDAGRRAEEGRRTP